MGDAWEISLLPFFVTQMWPQVSDLCTFPPTWYVTPRKGPSWSQGTKGHWIQKNLTLDQQSSWKKILIKRGKCENREPRQEPGAPVGRSLCCMAVRKNSMVVTAPPPISSSPLSKNFLSLVYPPWLPMAHHGCRNQTAILSFFTNKSFLLKEYLAGFLFMVHGGKWG